jgi:hypothetical protein
MIWPCEIYVDITYAILSSDLYLHNFALNVIRIVTSFALEWVN